MYTIRKLFKFEGAHILSESFSKECQKVHGHSYKVEVFISTLTLNPYGMVVDFKIISNVIGPIINQWDHQILFEGDSFPEFLQYQSLGYRPVEFNPTAENMCKYLYDKISIEVPANFGLKVRIHETDTGYAEYSEQGDNQ